LEAILMRVVSAVVLAIVLTPSAAVAQLPPPPATPPGVQKPEPIPPPTATSVRIFSAPTGLILNAVRPERVADFEKLVGYLQNALSSSSNATVRAQAQGWRVLKASEPGPNGAVLYVFLFDPAVPGADYGLGRILAEAYPDPTKLQEIWKLYTDSLASGGSLLNLTPVKPGAFEDSSLQKKSEDPSVQKKDEDPSLQKKTEDPPIKRK
jgi:hypothetical protein